MKKRKFFNTLSKKYDLPVKYIDFKLNRIYIYKSNIDVDMEYLKRIENAVNWEYMQLDFESDVNEYSSIFYGMKKPSEVIKENLTV